MVYGRLLIILKNKKKGDSKKKFLANTPTFDSFLLNHIYILLYAKYTLRIVKYSI